MIDMNNVREARFSEIDPRIMHLHCHHAVSAAGDLNIVF
jgi:hypothetical protein